jgi:hypothetical protein
MQQHAFIKLFFLFFKYLRKEIYETLVLFFSIQNCCSDKINEMFFQMLFALLDYVIFPSFVLRIGII